MYVHTCAKHTHTDIYIYIYIYVNVIRKKYRSTQDIVSKLITYMQITNPNTYIHTHNIHIIYIHTCINNTIPRKSH